MPAAPDAYQWLSTSVLQVAGCVTVVAVADEAKVKSAFGADSDPLVAPEHHYGSWAKFARSGTATVVVENNDFQGSRPEVPRTASKASESGKAASLFWNVEDLLIFTCARRGKLLASFELLDVNEEDLDGVPKSLHRLALSVNDESVDPIAIGAAMVERFTGVSFGPDVLDGTAYALTPPPDELRDFHPNQMWLYEDFFPELFDAVVAAAPQQQRTVATFAAHAAGREIGIENEPAVQVLLGGLNTNQRHIPPSITAAAAAAARQANAAGFQAIEDQAEGRDSGQLERTYVYQRNAAWTALRQATHHDPVSAAVTSLFNCLGAVAASTLRYGAIYIEDETGRHLDRVENATVDRQTQIADLAMRLLQERIGLDQALGELPTPLTEEDRSAALRQHQERFERGEFREYQIWRP